MAAIKSGMNVKLLLILTSVVLLASGCTNLGLGGGGVSGTGIVITGDTLFAGAVGRTDFHGGDMGKLKQSFDRLMSLPPETEVLTGHGPNSTIGRERVDNFFPKLFA